VEPEPGPDALEEEEEPSELSLSRDSEKASSIASPTEEEEEPGLDAQEEELQEADLELSKDLEEVP